GDELLGVLKPNTVLVSPWREVHPLAATIGRFVKARPDVNIFTTDVHVSNKSSLNPYVNNIKAWSGHVVVRVAPSGEYMVYMLDDTDQSYKVKSIHGPYRSE
ncbi:MAG: hypothetical protein K2M76_07660, partial [Muribaculaceae bacterium]|nr:hypothetical protein [Muribaculaceae bacterium]